ncbi:MAG TPA: hypothetical protein PLB89_05105 [Flavobacteriales bacterium]|nr:hypothetical protein [Flavobacteriales bacterium]
MGVRKNHILDALGDVHQEVCGFGDDVESLDYDDGESHSKKEAAAVAENQINEFIDRLVELKLKIRKKYK